MDDFTNRMEELNAKLTIKRTSLSQQNMVLQAEGCNGSAPTSQFITSLGNGSLTGSMLTNSPSSSQLGKESSFMDEVCHFLCMHVCLPPKYVYYTFLNMLCNIR